MCIRDSYKHPLGSGFVEATAAAATWFVPHDLAGLADLMGGKETAAKRLNQSFLKIFPQKNLCPVIQLL